MPDATPPYRSVEESARIDTSVAHASRMYDYMLGGTTHFAADRDASAHASAPLPGGQDGVRAGIRANRAFLMRAVTHLVRDAGIRQFLDVGSGIPSTNNVHEVAQSIAAESRVVYVDNDPIVLAHAHELLKSAPDGATSYIQADMRDPDTILREAAATLDLSRPVGLVLVAVLHFIRPEEDPYGIVARLLDALPPGSHLVVSSLASDIDPEAMAEAVRRINELTEETFVPRSRAEVARFFDGLELLEPGIVLVDRWRPDGSDPIPGIEFAMPFYAAVARKP